MPGASSDRQVTSYGAPLYEQLVGLSARQRPAHGGGGVRLLLNGSSRLQTNRYRLNFKEARWQIRRRGSRSVKLLLIYPAGMDGVGEFCKRASSVTCLWRMSRHTKATAQRGPIGSFAQGL